MAVNYADIIFFAIVAIYLALKLFSVLGKRDEEEPSRFEAKSFTVPANKKPDIYAAARPEKPVVEVPALTTEQIIEQFNFSDEDAKSGIKEIMKKDVNFNLKHFVDGAKMAFEMILKAFSEGDKKTMRELLSDELYADFEKKIDESREKKLIFLKTLVAIEKVQIVSAKILGSKVRIALKFLTEQINLVKDMEGKVLEGDARRIDNVEDEWEFERNMRSSNPNWQIVAV